MELTILLSILVFVAAILYSSVGHAGASGYIASMVLLGISTNVMKPTALVLNILVATIATLKFYKAGYFSWEKFLPFAIVSIPFSFLGGSLTSPDKIYKLVVGLVLLYSAFRMFFYKNNENVSIKNIPIIYALICGSLIGFLSGLIGVGGGIFLSPLLLMMNWSDVKQTSGISAMFILVNSISGLLGHISSLNNIPDNIIYLLFSAFLGGWIGSEYGSKKFSRKTIQQLLSIVLFIASSKLLFS